MGVIDNQILLLKYECQSGERCKEVHRNFILTYFFEPSSIDTIKHTLYVVKTPGRFASLGLGRAAVCDCGTPWTFLLPFFAVEYNVSLSTDFMSSADPGSIAYLYGFIQGTHRNMPKYAPLELQRGIQEYHHIKNDFDYGG